MKQQKFVRRKIGLVFGITFVVGIFLFSGIYLSDYYKADFQRIESFLEYSDSNKNQKVNKSILNDGTIVYSLNENSKIGIIFYPGGKVEYNAYEPLLKLLSENGIACFLVKMPFNLAVFSVNAAEKVINQFSEIDEWYVAGHSLGGAMAASFLGKNQFDMEGLILLASYSTVDFSNSEIKLLSVFGSNDSVMNMEKYQHYKINFPKGFVEQIIYGGNHAGFGFYGNQDGDGKLEITSENQIEQTAKLIADFIKSQ